MLDILSHKYDIAKMEANLRVVKNYVTPEGEVPFVDWLRSLKDKRSIAIVLQRIDRVQLGNFGDCRSVGSGVYELKIRFGSGLRIYFGIANAELVILLCAGDKSSQRKDIPVAQKYWKEYKKNAD